MKLDELKLQAVFEKALGIEAPDFSSLEFSKTAEWDSIAHMRLVAALEEEFQLRLTIDEILSLNSYSTAKELVSKYQAE